ncbi:MAG: M48 family metallopeptidase [Desulfobacterales bacterium]|nr:M48 family metallopeptidase [Desulfobacterales bacterium]
MNQDRELDIKGIGLVLFAASSRARRINISVRGPGRVRVAVPRGVSLDRAKAVVTEQGEWIRNHLARMAEIAPRQEAMRQRLRVNDPGAAARQLTARLAELALLYGFDYEKVTIRKQKTRWGSCSASNNISLNIKLAVLPRELRDYVLLHELVHTRIHNHQPGFWQALEKIMPDARARRRRLRQYGLGLD